MKPVYKFLKDSRAVIEKYGWIQNTAGSKALGFCLMGAIGEVTTANYNANVDGVLQTEMAAREVLRKALRGIHGKGYYGLAAINDEMLKSKQDALDGFTAAMRLAR